MATTHELKDKINTKTLNLVLLTIATAGIYPIIWLYKNYQVIDDVTGSKTASEIYIIWIAVCAGLGGAFSGTGEGILDVVGGILGIASSVLFIVWAFKARTALIKYTLQSHKIDLKMNRFYTLIFNIYYINYCINDLPEIERKQTIINSARTSEAS